MVVVTHQAKKIWTYDCMGIYTCTTFSMHGQLHHRYANAMALSSSTVVSGLGSESDDPGLSLGRGKALLLLLLLFF